MRKLKALIITAGIEKKKYYCQKKHVHNTRCKYVVKNIKKPFNETKINFIYEISKYIFINNLLGFEEKFLEGLLDVMLEDYDNYMLCKDELLDNDDYNYKMMLDIFLSKPELIKISNDNYFSVKKIKINIYDPKSYLLGYINCLDCGIKPEIDNDNGIIIGNYYSKSMYSCIYKIY